MVVSMSSHIVNARAEAVGSDLITRLRSQFDVILFDVGSFDERLAARVASSLADQVVLVCRCHDAATFVDPIARQLQRTAEGRVGFVHNFALNADPGVRRYLEKSGGNRTLLRRLNRIAVMSS